MFIISCLSWWGQVKDIKSSRDLHVLVCSTSKPLKMQLCVSQWVLSTMQNTLLTGSSEQHRAQRRMFCSFIVPS